MPGVPPSPDDPICAVATPPGRGALAVVRLSGRGALAIAGRVTRKELIPRKAVLTGFRDGNGERIDQGLALYFQAPASFTGEDLVEFHCHGNPVVCGMLMDALCAQGARRAEPGEFSLRAFLNNKLDLAQAEAIADLISSTTEQCVRTAGRSLQGAFSRRVKEVLEGLVGVRTGVEACLDFPDEDSGALPGKALHGPLSALDGDLDELLEQARSGERLHAGATVAIVGAPNVGKSSLINALAQSEIAIVTAVPGTTRDPVVADIEVHGLPVRLVDTAGLRTTGDEVEQLGIERTRRILAEADLVLWLDDLSQPDSAGLAPEGVEASRVIRVHNKTDLVTRHAGAGRQEVYLSVKTGSGMEALVERIRERVLGREQGSTPFLARARHLDALQRTQAHVRSALQCLHRGRDLELAGEDLRLAQQALGEITGEFSSDDLLGSIFSEFCIGK
ncbi:MAG: tRNA uridine-5-carboxymethylaminomethyl(34) synthesis GTPase MnmE [Gammaproteobacteria bacterium]|nr:tRNA uridine-5-carboxymethylaminomethyl(34) synthesis GTPase MnmE [Gammaproteobacteria bacterium]